MLTVYIGLRKSVVGDIKRDTCILKTDNHSKEYDMKIQYANEFVKRLG